jgi:type I thyroxine 5'-deiodinase
VLNKLYEQYRDRAAFYIVYIQEAHPSDVWQMQSNVRQHVVFLTPKNNEERSEIAGACVRNLHLTIPALLDPFENPTERAYTGWPDRLYVIDRNGKVAYKSRPGPFGFHSEEMELALKTVLATGLREHTNTH